VADYLEVKASLLAEVLDLTAELTRKRDGAPVDLVTNLGRYQEVKLLHFHVIPAAKEAAPNEVPAERVDELLAATTLAARAALASAGQARVVISPTDSGVVGWRVE
jgi:diadenosine tetraphosphate (Ap4A) HIT family hydrolase